MTMYSTLFLAEPSALAPAFQTWLTCHSQKRNVAGWPSANEDNREIAETESNRRTPDRAIRSPDSYPGYLELRIPTFVQNQSHWCAKNLCSVELNPLILAATGVDTLKLESALVFRETASAILEVFPNDFVVSLQRASEFVIRHGAAKWAAMMSTPQFTHSVSGVRVEDDWTVEGALHLLRPIVELSRAKTNNQHLYLLVEY
jgi:hypothetical protein